MKRNKSPLNTTALSKKYKCDINKIIRFWKNDKSDFEVSHALGIDSIKLLTIRQEITSLYEKERQQRLKKERVASLVFTDKG